MKVTRLSTPTSAPSKLFSATPRYAISSSGFATTLRSVIETIVRDSTLARNPRVPLVTSKSSRPVPVRLPPAPAQTSALLSVRARAVASVIAGLVLLTSPRAISRLAFTMSSPSSALSAVLPLTCSFWSLVISKSTSRSSGSLSSGSVSRPVAVAQSIRCISSVPVASVALFNFTVPLAHSSSPGTPTNWAFSIEASIPM